MQWPDLDRYGLTLTLRKRAGEPDQLWMEGLTHEYENALAACGFVKQTRSLWVRDPQLPLRVLGEAFVGMRMGERDPSDVIVVDSPSPAPTKPRARRRKPPADRIEDFGEHIGGARKDQWDRSRGIRSVDVEHWTSEERAELLTKERVWPRPDYKGRLEEGADLGVLMRIRRIRAALDPYPARLVRKVRRLGDRGRLATQPDTTEARQCEYLASVGALADALSRVRTPEDFARVCDGYIVRTTSTEKRWDGTEYKVHRSELTGAAEVLFDHLESHKRTGRFLRGHELFNPETLGKDTALAEREDWPFRSRRIPRGRSAREDEPVRQPLSHIVREGGPLLRDGDVRPEDFATTFGFRGGEFGNWVSQSERQACLNHGFDALTDLAKVLDVPPRALSLGGTLAIAFGARGRGGRASAHYEPGRRVINLTKPSGAGALAHEFGHALDHWMARVGQGNVDYMHPYVSAKDGSYQLAHSPFLDQCPELLRAVDALNDFIAATKQRRPEEGELRGMLEEQAAVAIERLNRSAKWMQTTAHNWLLEHALASVPKNERDCARQWMREELAQSPALRRLAEASERVQNTDTWVLSREEARTVVGELRDAFASIVGDHNYREVHEQMMATAHGVVSKAVTLALPPERFAAVLSSYDPVPTKYWSASRAWDGNKNQGKGYYATSWEMFARAFETCVESELSDEGMRSDYLVHSARYRGWDEHPKGSPYPMGEDLNALRKQFDELKAPLRSVMVTAMEMAEAKANVEVEPRKDSGPRL